MIECLYIEDNIDNHFLIGFYGKDLLNIQFAETTDAALTLIHNQSFDLIIIDLNLPGSYTSWEIIEKIERHYNIPPQIWILSAMQKHEIQHKLQQHPEVSFITKPIRKQEFVDKLKTTFPDKI
jgi:CheY-like chemotaxis protein